jgi:hypothetical protein
MPFLKSILARILNKLGKMILSTCKRMIVGQKLMDNSTHKIVHNQNLMINVMNKIVNKLLEPNDEDPLIQSSLENKITIYLFYLFAYLVSKLLSKSKTKLTIYSIHDYFMR